MAMRHIHECKFRRQACPLGCGEKLLLIEIELHRMACPELVVTCDKCNEQIKPNQVKGKQAAHDCFKNLRSLIGKMADEDQILDIQMGHNLERL